MEEPEQAQKALAGADYLDGALRIPNSRFLPMQSDWTLTWRSPIRIWPWRNSSMGKAAKLWRRFRRQFRLIQRIT
jgi:hypothetical protein